MDEYAKLVSTQALARPSDSVVTEWVEERVASNDQEIYAQVLTEGLRSFDASSAISSIQLPTLVVVGEHDQIISPQKGYDLAANIPAAHLVEIAGVGHLSYMEAPKMFNATVLDFLAQH